MGGVLDFFDGEGVVEFCQFGVGGGEGENGLIVGIRREFVKLAVVRDRLFFLDEVVQAILGKSLFDLKTYICLHREGTPTHRSDPERVNVGLLVTPGAAAGKHKDNMAHCSVFPHLDLDIAQDWQRQWWRGQCYLGSIEKGIDIIHSVHIRGAVTLNTSHFKALQERMRSV